MRWLAAAGLAALEGLVAWSYQDRGTWWHWMLHQYVGWGLGLAVGGLLAVALRRRVPAVGAMVLGQLVSIFPDLMFRFMRMPHEQWMDWWVGHISMHTGPSPLLVALLVLLLGGSGWLLAASRPRLAVAVCVSGPVLLLVACLLARPIPTSLSDYAVTAGALLSR